MSRHLHRHQNPPPEELCQGLDGALWVRAEVQRCGEAGWVDQTTVGNASLFKNGRQFAAWLGLTPRQYSTGGKARLGRISKRGDRYLRTLLVHGARSELTHTAGRGDHKSQWVEQLKKSKTWNKTAVALANKHARIIWSMLAKDQDYQPA